MKTGASLNLLNLNDALGQKPIRHAISTKSVFAKQLLDLKPDLEGENLI